MQKTAQGHFVWAWIIDVVIISLLCALLGVLLLMPFGKSINPEGALSFVGYGGLVSFWLATAWGYFAIRDTLGVRSCGEAIMDLPVKNREERKVESLARSFDIILVLILSAFLLLILWGSTLDPLARAMFLILSVFLIIFVWSVYHIVCKVLLKSTLGEMLFCGKKSK